MDGPWMAKIHSSQKLTEADTDWLMALKRTAELLNRDRRCLMIRLADHSGAVASWLQSTASDHFSE